MYKSECYCEHFSIDDISFDSIQQKHFPLNMSRHVGKVLLFQLVIGVSSRIITETDYHKKQDFYGISTASCGLVVVGSGDPYSVQTIPSSLYWGAHCRECDYTEHFNFNTIEDPIYLRRNRSIEHSILKNHTVTCEQTVGSCDRNWDLIQGVQVEGLAMYFNQFNVWLNHL